jgi:hypothetical protein
MAGVIVAILSLPIIVSFFSLLTFNVEIVYSTIEGNKRELLSRNISSLDCHDNENSFIISGHNDLTGCANV